MPGIVYAFGHTQGTIQGVAKRAVAPGAKIVRPKLSQHYCISVVKIYIMLNRYVVYVVTRHNVRITLYT